MEYRGTHSDLINAWNKQRLLYQHRYVNFLQKWEETDDPDIHGHAMEASFVLISMFGLTEKEMRQLEKNGYAGLLDRDLED